MSIETFVSTNGYLVVSSASHVVTVAPCRNREHARFAVLLRSSPRGRVGGRVVDAKRAAEALDREGDAELAEWVRGFELGERAS